MKDIAPVLPRSHHKSMRLAALAMTVSVWSVARRFGAVGLVVAGFIGDSMLPLPGVVDALTVVLAGSHPGWWPLYGGLAAGSSVTGGYVAYRIGHKGGEKLLEKRLSQKRLRKVRQVFKKGGAGAVFVAALMPPPMPMMPFTIGAGAMKLPRRRFLAALAAGRVLRFAAVAWLASRFGRQVMGFLGEYYRPILYVLLGLTLAGTVAGLVLLLRSRKRVPDSRKAA